MSKVSVLMNCFNGEKFLSKALDSVFNQTYKHWDIVFIDNCSTDNSAKIAKKYGQKINYYKTPKNIPLGAARKFGVDKCENFIAILDCDDIWLPNCLSDLMSAILSGDFSLAYGHQILIDKSGKKIGKIKNKYAGLSGNLFGKLLNQFDIPLVASLFRKDKMFSMNLNFDESIHGSEEYCLFMQMASKSDFIAIDKFLVKYRRHNSLTVNLNEKIFEERFYTLNKIISENRGIEKKYKNEFKEAFSRGVYYKSQYLIKSKQKKLAFKEMKSIMFINYKYFLLTLLLLFPGNFIWNFIQKIKYKR